MCDARSPADGLDRPSAALSAAAGGRTSAALALQDWLNAQDGALWGLACNGERLRLLRDNPSLTRPAYIEADLRRIFEADALADFSALWLLMHATRFGQPGAPAADCILERWRDAGQKAGEAARERLRDGVEQALARIGDGLLRHPANRPLRDRLAAGDLPLPEFFGQLLRLVYRMIFLLAAEDRGLLHPPETGAAARTLYAQGYSLSRLRARAVRPAAWDSHDDLWEGICILFGALARGEPRLGLPALDGLFAPGGTPALDGAILSNKALLRAVRGLAWLEGAAGPVPVNWRDMQTEELGSVYEALLELTPLLTDDGHGFAFAEGAETRGNQRKTTGSYYTPDSLVQALLASALDPVLDRVQAEAEDPAAALLGVRVLDPACGSGHFLLAAGRRVAVRLARLRAGGTAGSEEYRHALRDVARDCLYGVDRNPMAVELAKVALWIETVEPGKPLGFLDANLRCGDALLGVFDLDALRLGIPDAAFKPLAGDDRIACRALDARNKSERRGQGTLNLGGAGGRLPPAAPLALADKAWRALPEDSPAEIAAKRARFEAARAASDSYALQVACDLYVAAFLSPKPAGAEATPRTSLVPTTAAVWARAAGAQVFGPLEGRAVDLTRAARAFHWPLEFPYVMDAGGFDVVLGNPPWDRIKLQEQEFFAAVAPDVAAAPNAAERSRRIAALQQAPDGSRDRLLFERFEIAKRVSESSSVFARLPEEQAGRFPLTGRGDVNTYSLFAELFTHATSRHGRAGVIVPTGIATDGTTAPFFASLIARKQLISLLDFENRQRLFPAVDSRMKFCLLTTGHNPDDVDFAFFLTDTAQLTETERRFSLSLENIAKLNPNSLTAPVLRSRKDVELSAKIVEATPILSADRGSNPWSFDYMTKMFDMADSSDFFWISAKLQKCGAERDGLTWTLNGTLYTALYEAKMVTFFDHRAASYAKRGDERGYRVLPETTENEHSDPTYEVEPFYWLEEKRLQERLSDRSWCRPWLMGWKDIAAVTNERTATAAIFPKVAVGHTIRVMFADSTNVNPAMLVANLNSLVVDYMARLKFGGLHLTVEILRQLPVLPPSAYSPAALAFIVPRVLELTYTSHSLAPFARDLGHQGPPFAWDPPRRALLRAELDAWYARAYGLTRDELRYVLDPADVYGPDYPSETFRVLRDNEVRRYGEYRTQRLVLEAWDNLGDETR